MPVIIFTTYKWSLFGYMPSHCQSCLEGCGSWWTELRRVYVRKLNCIWRGDVIRFIGHNPKFGMKKLLFCSAFKLGVCPARDSQLLTLLEYTWKQKSLNQPWTGKGCQFFWKHRQNPTISQNFQRRQGSVCISMEKVLNALETIPGFTFSLKGKSHCCE